MAEDPNDSSEEVVDDHDHEPHGDQCVGIDPETLEQAAELFKALADPSRLWLLERLSKSEHCVSELAEESGDQLSTVSQRLRHLRARRLVKRRREGKHIFYSLADDHVSDVIDKVIEHVQEEED